MIQQVVPGGPAAAAGLRPGDVIIRIGDTPIEDRADLEYALSTQYKPGDTVPVTVIRDAKRNDGPGQTRRPTGATAAGPAAAERRRGGSTANERSCRTGERRARKQPIPAGRGQRSCSGGDDRVVSGGAARAADQAASSAAAGRPDRPAAPRGAALPSRRHQDDPAVGPGRLRQEHAARDLGGSRHTPDCLAVARRARRRSAPRSSERWLRPSRRCCPASGRTRSPSSICPSRPRRRCSRSPSRTSSARCRSRWSWSLTTTSRSALRSCTSCSPRSCYACRSDRTSSSRLERYLRCHCRPSGPKRSSPRSGSTTFGLARARRECSWIIRSTSTCRSGPSTFLLERTEGLAGRTATGGDLAP